MSLHIIIDGYNLIRQSPALGAAELQSLEEGREALCERLVVYKRLKGHPITVVFDGTRAPNLGVERRRRMGIDILFSRYGELADSVIKRLVAKEGQRAVVVTSDKEVREHAARLGAATIGSEEFEHKMTMAVAMDSVSDDTVDQETGWRPTTKKKGPARRRSKRDRRSRVKTRKL